MPKIWKSGIYEFVPAILITQALTNFHTITSGPLCNYVPGLAFVCLFSSRALLIISKPIRSASEALALTFWSIKRQLAQWLYKAWLNRHRPASKLFFHTPATSLKSGVLDNSKKTLSPFLTTSFLSLNLYDWLKLAHLLMSSLLQNYMWLNFCSNCWKIQGCTTKTIGSSQTLNRILKIFCRELLNLHKWCNGIDYCLPWLCNKGSWGEENASSRVNEALKY